MRSLRKISREELGEWKSRERRRFLFAVGLAIAASGLALLGQMWRYPQPGMPTPLPGMDTFQGQLGWSLLLGAVMIAAAWLVRSVAMARLQAAVVVSLLLHLLLVLAAWHMQLALPVALVKPTEQDRGEDPVELTLPDYGGMEAPDVEEQEWERPSDTTTPDPQLDPQKKAEIEPEIELERDQTQPKQETQVTKAQPLERRETKPAEPVPEQMQAEMQRKER